MPKPTRLQSASFHHCTRSTHQNLVTQVAVPTIPNFWRRSRNGKCKTSIWILCLVHQLLRFFQPTMMSKLWLCPISILQWNCSTKPSTIAHPTKLLHQAKFLCFFFFTATKMEGKIILTIAFFWQHPRSSPIIPGTSFTVSWLEDRGISKYDMGWITYHTTSFSGYS